METAGKLV